MDNQNVTYSVVDKAVGTIFESTDESEVEGFVTAMLKRKRGESIIKKGIEWFFPSNPYNSLFVKARPF